MNELDPMLASETLIKFILFSNIVFLILSFFVEYDYKGFLAILIFNILFLIIRQGIRSKSDEIISRGK